MELDQSALQWLFNVVMITGFTSLVLLCYVFKKENQKLTFELGQRQLRDQHSMITMRGAAPAGSISEQKTGPTELPLEPQDIRAFVARRSGDWFASTR